MNTGLAVVLAFMALANCVCATHKESRGDQLEGINECMALHNISQQDMEQIKQGNYTHERYKCFSTCFGGKLGYLNSEGKFDNKEAIHLARTFYSNKTELIRAEEVIKDCAKEIKAKSPEGCDMGPVVMGCLLIEAQKKQILPKYIMNMLEQNQDSS